MPLDTYGNRDDFDKHAVETLLDFDNFGHVVAYETAYLPQLVKEKQRCSVVYFAKLLKLSAEAKH